MALLPSMWVWRFQTWPHAWGIHALSTVPFPSLEMAYFNKHFYARITYFFPHCYLLHRGCWLLLTNTKTEDSILLLLFAPWLRLTEPVGSFFNRELLLLLYVNLYNTLLSPWWGVNYLTCPYRSPLSWPQPMFRPLSHWCPHHSSEEQTQQLPAELATLPSSTPSFLLCWLLLSRAQHEWMCPNLS